MKNEERGVFVYMFADDANTGNRRDYCHFLYWKTSVSLLEFNDCDSELEMSRYYLRVSFVMAHDPPHFTGRSTPFSVAVSLHAGKHLRIRISNMYLYELIPYPSYNMSNSC